MKSLLFLSWFESPYTFIAEFSCLNSYNVFTLAEVNILEHNAVYVVRLLLGDFISVYVKCSILLVAIYFHIRHFVFAIQNTSATELAPSKRRNRRLLRSIVSLMVSVR